MLYYNLTISINNTAPISRGLVAAIYWESLIVALIPIDVIRLVSIKNLGVKFIGNK